MAESDKHIKEQWDEATKAGGETTVERSAQVLTGYEPKRDDAGQIVKENGEPIADTDKPVYEDRPLPEVGSIIDRPHGRRAKVVSAQVRDGSQVIGLQYVD